MEKNFRVFMLSCIKHARFHVFSPFSAYFSPHDIIAENGLFSPQDKHSYTICRSILKVMYIIIIACYFH